jgi:hypothetical protein
MMASHPPNSNAHVVRHKPVKLFIKFTAAILDDDNLTGKLISASLGYEIPVWFGIQSLMVHYLTARQQMGRLR